MAEPEAIDDQAADGEATAKSTSTTLPIVYLQRKKFLSYYDLIVGVYLYGALNTAGFYYFYLKPALTGLDWLVFLGILTPATTLFVQLLRDRKNYGYIKANWYFAFLGLILASVYIVA